MLDKWQTDGPNGATVQVDAYLNETVLGVKDWQEIHRPYLEKAHRCLYEESIQNSRRLNFVVVEAVELPTWTFEVSVAQDNAVTQMGDDSITDFHQLWYRGSLAVNWRWRLGDGEETESASRISRLGRSIGLKGREGPRKWERGKADGLGSQRLPLK